MTRSLDDLDWDNTLESIDDRKCTPLISNQIILDQLFKGRNLTAAWAEEIGYPLDDKSRLSRVAQYLRVTRDSVRAKREYIRFLKRSLLERAEQEKLPDHVVKGAREEMRRKTISELAQRLTLVDFESQPENPLRILAELRIPIYLTTSYHDFIEQALTAAGKEPRSEICCWNESLDDLVEDDTDFEPTVESPLVYHLFGRDKVPESMVLTEDDYLDYLVTVSRDDRIADRVNQAFASSLLLVLGYNLRSWDFRVLLRVLTSMSGASRRPKPHSIQLPPAPPADAPGSLKVEEIQGYLQRYLGDVYDFEVYWGDVDDFAGELWKQWNEP